MVTIIDYGVGNLFSLASSFAYIGQEATVTSDPDEIKAAERLILPGVGAFGDAAAKLDGSGIGDAVKDAAARGVPLLGICLGMQLLFDESSEYGTHAGLGLIRGQVRPIKDAIRAGLKIPHIGWNALDFTDLGRRCPLFLEIKEGDFVYFVHSFHAEGCRDAVTATAEYGADLTAAVWDGGSVFGTQFHPEKSGDVGLSILRAFSKIKKGGAC